MSSKKIAQTDDIEGGERGGLIRSGREQSKIKGKARRGADKKKALGANCRFGVLGRAPGRLRDACIFTADSSAPQRVCRRCIVANKPGAFSASLEALLVLFHLPCLRTADTSFIFLSISIPLKLMSRSKLIIIKFVRALIGQLSRLYNIALAALKITALDFFFIKETREESKMVT